MKNILKKFISFILIVTLFLGSTTSAFGNNKNILSEAEIKKDLEKDYKDEYINLFGNLDIKNFENEYFYEIIEYRFTRRPFSKEYFFRIYTEVHSKNDKKYKISYDIDFNENFEIIDDWLYY